MGQTNTTYAFLVGGGFSIFAYLVGGFDNLILSLAIMMGVDFVSGILVGAKNGYEQSQRFKATGFVEAVKVGVSSKKAFIGLMRKSAMFLAVIVAVRLDMLMGSEKGFLRNSLIMCFIGTEGISFIENMGKIGVTLPKQFTETFAQLTQKGNTTPVVEKQEVVQPFTSVEPVIDEVVAVVAAPIPPGDGEL
jgi:toxin secretion/phage lysis holin